MRRAAKVDAGMFVGVLCAREHRYDGADASLRYSSGHCAECFKLARQARMSDPVKRAHDERKRKEREAVRRPAKGVVRTRRPEELSRQIHAAAKRQKRAETPEAVRAAARDSYTKNDLKVRLRNRVAKAFRQQGANKVAIVGGHRIDVPAIVAHLGPRPGPGCDWHIDHIKPLAAFDLSDPEQVSQAFAPKNHQWLPALENIRKGAKHG